MKELFHITVGWDEINRRYAIATFDALANEASGTAGSLNKAWKTTGDRIKDREKERKNFPIPEPPKANGSIIVKPNDIQLPMTRKIITLEG